MGRFINGDGFTSTGQGLLGNNMFAYCGNNPANNSDPTGQFWSEIWEFAKTVFTETSKIMGDASNVYAWCSNLGQVDGQMPVCDVIGGVGAGLITVGALGLAFYNIATAPSSSIIDSDQKKTSTSAELGSIASGFDIYECKEAADEMVAYLKRNNKNGQIITITFTGGKGYVWSDLKQDVIATNGVHVGVEYKGRVYCNVHPYGLPAVEWVEDFYGTGIKMVTPIPF